MLDLLLPTSSGQKGNRDRLDTRPPRVFNRTGSIPLQVSPSAPPLGVLASGLPKDEPAANVPVHPAP